MLVVDTGPLVAAADIDDPDHRRCVDLLASAIGPLVTTGLVLAEAGFLIARQVGPTGEAALVADVAEGRLTVEELTIPAWVCVRELVERCADLPLGVTDASIVALAEHHGLLEIATLDRRHFHIVRPANGDTFTLLP